MQHHLEDIRAEIEAKVSVSVPDITRELTQRQSVILGLPGRPRVATDGIRTTFGMRKQASADESAESRCRSAQRFVWLPQICPVVNESIVSFEHHLQTMNGTAGIQNAYFHQPIF